VKLDKETAAKVLPLLKNAIAAAIQQRELIGKIEEEIAGPEDTEANRMRVESLTAQFVECSAADFETAEGFGLLDVEELFEELGE
jgi:hypothetical protein